MGQNQSSDEEGTDDEEMLRCIFSDPGQSHNFSHRGAEKIKRDCTACGNDPKLLMMSDYTHYYCNICDLEFHEACLNKPNPKSHHHSLALLPRPLSFPCNACGLIDEDEPSFACYQCNYVVHQSCIDLPRVIKITRHLHRLSHTPYLPVKVLPCRICYRNVDIKYGQYSCNHDDCSYVAHSKCATHKSIWDGKELEWESEECGNNAEDIAPYKKVGGGLIEHCWHENHYLKLENYDGKRDLKKQCQACMHSIISRDFYSCIECDFFLHEVCANLPRKVDHALHINTLSMEPYPRYNVDFMMSHCSACSHLSSGMKYSCRKKGCVYKGKKFQVDANCILVPECFTHESHAEHSLFISSFIYTDESEIHCEGCNREVDGYHLECVSCEFALCYRCATIPHEIYHKYDEDPLTLCYGEDGVEDTYWCEVCVPPTLPRSFMFKSEWD
ncbi:hypothetical protein Bca101_045345 [Brassica carinata]